MKRIPKHILVTLGSLAVIALICMGAASINYTVYFYNVDVKTNLVVRGSPNLTSIAAVPDAAGYYKNDGAGNMTIDNPAGAGDVVATTPALTNNAPLLGDSSKNIKSVNPTTFATAIGTDALQAGLGQVYESTNSYSAGTGIVFGGKTIYASNVVENAITLADNTTNDVGIAKHGFVPKAPNSAAQFLDGTGAWSTPAGTTYSAGTGIAIGGTTIYATNVVENAQNLTDNTTNDVSIAKHGYAPKAPNDATKFLDGTGAWTVPAGGGSVANPTATIVNNTAINGVATSAIRSDGAPAISTTGVFQFGRLGLGAAADATHILTLAGGTVTADTHLLDATETWNSGGVTFTGLKLNITDTASAAASLLLDIGTGGGSYTSQFKVTKAGAVTAAGALTAAGITASGNNNVTAGAGGWIGMTGRSQMNSPVNGVFAMFNATAVSFTGLRLGLDQATPSNVYLRPGDGSGTDKNGGNLSLEGGISSGTGRGGAIIMKRSSTSTTSSSANVQSEAFHIPAKYIDLTDNTATTLFTVTLPATNCIGMAFVCTVQAGDGTDFQSLTTQVTVDAVAKTTTITAVVAPTAAQTALAASSGSTLSVTYTVVDNGSNVLAVKATADTSFGSPTYLRAKLVMHGINIMGAGTVINEI